SFSYTCHISRTRILLLLSFLLFFTHTATPEISTLSLHDALPILQHDLAQHRGHDAGRAFADHVFDLREILFQHAPFVVGNTRDVDRKSTRLNSSHVKISYAVFCLKKKKKQPEL